MKNGFRKLRRRWLLSVAAVFLLFPLLLLGIMGVHEYRGEGFAFTNLDEIFFAQRLMSLIKDQRFEEAAELIDFEASYLEIQEVLGWKPEDYLPPAALCTVDGELWTAAAWLEEQYRLQSLCENEDSEQVWSYLFLNKIQGILVPETVWKQLGLEFNEDMEFYEVCQSYFPIDTPWGRFYVNREYENELGGEADITAGQLVQLLDFIPYEIYQAAQESLERTAQELYQWNQNYYAFAADMTQEDYVRVMKEQFVRTLETCYSNGVTVQSPHFSDAYRIGRQWEIEISAVRQDFAEQSYRVKYLFMVQNGKLRVIGGSHPDGLSDDPIAAALRMARP